MWVASQRREAAFRTAARPNASFDRSVARAPRACAVITDNVVAGQVRVDGQVASRVAANITADASITIDQSPRFVSRGGEKLEAALEAFAEEP